MHKIIATSPDTSPFSFTEVHQEISDMLNEFTKAAAERNNDQLFPIVENIFTKLLPLFENPSHFSNIYTHLLATKILGYCSLAPDLHLFLQDTFAQFHKITGTESLHSLIFFCNQTSLALYMQNSNPIPIDQTIAITELIKKNQQLLLLFCSPQHARPTHEEPIATTRNIYLNRQIIGELYTHEHIGDGNCFYQAIIDAIALQKLTDAPPRLSFVKRPDLLRDTSHSLSETTFRQWHHLEINPHLEANKLLSQKPIDKDIFIKNLYLEISNLIREYAKPCTLKTQSGKIPIPKILREHPLLTISLETHFTALMKEQNNLYTNPNFFTLSETPELIPGALEKIIPDESLRHLIGLQITARLNELAQTFMAMGGPEASQIPDNLEFFEQCLPSVALSEILMHVGTQFDESSQTLLRNPIIKALGDAYIADIDINKTLFKQPKLTYTTKEEHELPIKDIATKKYATSPEICIFTQLFPIQISLADQTGNIHVVTNTDTTDAELVDTLQNPRTIHLFLENDHYGVLSNTAPKPKSEKRKASPDIENPKRKKESDPSLIFTNSSNQEMNMGDYQRKPLLSSGTFWQVLELHLSQSHSEKILGTTHHSIQDAFIAKHDALIREKNPSYLKLIQEQVLGIAEQIIDADDEEIEKALPKTHAEAKNFIYETNEELQLDTVGLDALFQKSPEENIIIKSLRQDLQSEGNQELTFLPVSTLRFIAQEFGIYFAEQLGETFLCTDTKQAAHELSDPNQTLLISFDEMSGKMSLLTPK